MMNRRIPLLVLGIYLLAALAACAPTATPQPTATSELPTAMPSPEPIVVTDSLGHELTLPATPERIVSLAPSNTEILFAVGAGDNVVGVTEYCDYPEEVQAIEKIGGFSAKTISVEKVVALEPDLVVAGDESHRPVREALEQVNIPVLSMSADTLEDVHANILLVGHVTGHETQAEQVVEDMKNRVQAVRETVAPIPEEERLTVFWEVFDEPLMTAGPATFNSQMIELAGGISIFGDLEGDYPQINAEEVIARNPDIIMSSDTHGEKLTQEQVADRPGWEQIDAVKNNRIHLIDGNIVSRPGPRLADAVEAIAAALYPERFE